MQSIYVHSEFFLLPACYSPIRLAAWPSSLRRHSFVQRFPGPLAIEPHGILVRSGTGPRTKEQVTRSQKCSQHWNRDDVSLQSEMCTYCCHIARCAHIIRIYTVYLVSWIRGHKYWQRTIDCAVNVRWGSWPSASWQVPVGALGAGWDDVSHWCGRCILMYIEYLIFEYAWWRNVPWLEWKGNGMQHRTN